MKRRTALKTTATTVLGLVVALPAAVAVLAALLLAPLGGSAQAQDLKDKTIRIVVPFPPGGTADNIARLITQQANTAGFKLIVENRPGAGTIIGTEQVARAAPDGTSISGCRLPSRLKYSSCSLSSLVAKAAARRR